MNENEFENIREFRIDMSRVPKNKILFDQDQIQNRIPVSIKLLQNYQQLNKPQDLPIDIPPDNQGELNFKLLKRSTMKKNKLSITDISKTINEKGKNQQNQQEYHQHLENILEANTFLKQVKQQNQFDRQQTLRNKKKSSSALKQTEEIINFTNQPLVTNEEDIQKINNEGNSVDRDISLSNKFQANLEDSFILQEEYTPKIELSRFKRCKKYSFPLYGKLAVGWKVFLLIHIAYICFIIPYRIAFDPDPAIKDVVIDFYITIVFVCDMIITFLTPIPDSDGKLNYDKNKIAVKYIKRWFFLDAIVCFPLTYFRYTSTNEFGSNDMKNLITLNFGQIPRVYEILLLTQLARLRKGGKLMKDVMKKLSFKIELANILQNFCILVFMIHLIGCLFTTSASFDLGNYKNWITASNQQDESDLDIYISSIYFAIVTCATVGYGDIEPQNKYETMLTCIIIVFGVSYYSYILSDLSNHFSELQKENKIKEDRTKIIDEMERKYKVSEKVLTKIKFFYKEYDSNLDLSNHLEMSYLLRILPSSVKTQLAIFLYKDAINVIKFLQGRSNTFYEQYLDKLKPMRFGKDTVILEQGSRPNEVCLIMSGQVLNSTTGRIMAAGTLFGEGDIIFKRERKDKYIADTEVYIFKYDRKIFEILLKQYPEIEEEVHSLAFEREKVRNNQEAIKTMIQEDQVKDVIMKYFEQIKEAEQIYQARMNQNNSTKLKKPPKRGQSIILDNTADQQQRSNETQHVSQINEDALQKLNSNATTKEIYQILQKSIATIMKKGKQNEENLKFESSDSEDEIYNSIFLIKKENIKLDGRDKYSDKERHRVERSKSVKKIPSSNSQNYSNQILNLKDSHTTFSTHLKSRKNQNNIKIQSQSSLRVSSKSKSEFISKKYGKLPPTNHQNRIMNIRADINNNLEVFLETKKLIEQHLKNMKDAINQENLPLGIKETYKHGINGLEKYKLMMENMSSQLIKNRKVTNRLFAYQNELNQINQEMNESESKVVSSFNLMETKLKIDERVRFNRQKSQEAVFQNYRRNANRLESNQNLENITQEPSNPQSHDIKPFKINKDLMNLISDSIGFHKTNTEKSNATIKSIQPLNILNQKREDYKALQLQRQKHLEPAQYQSHQTLQTLVNPYQTQPDSPSSKKYDNENVQKTTEQDLLDSITRPNEFQYHKKYQSIGGVIYNQEKSSRSVRDEMNSERINRMDFKFEDKRFEEFQVKNPYVFEESNDNYQDSRKAQEEDKLEISLKTRSYQQSKFKPHSLISSRYQQSQNMDDIHSFALNSNKQSPRSFQNHKFLFANQNQINQFNKGGVSVEMQEEDQNQNNQDSLNINGTDHKRYKSYGIDKLIQHQFNSDKHKILYEFQPSNQQSQQFQNNQFKKYDSGRSSQGVTENSSFHLSKLNAMKVRLQSLKRAIQN